MAYSNGQALLVHPKGSAQALDISTGLASCLAAEWSPSGTVAALIGHPAAGLTAPVSSRTTASPPPLSAIQNTPLSMQLLLLDATGNILAAVHVGAGVTSGLAWAPNGEQLAAAAGKCLFIFSLRTEGKCVLYGERAIAIAKTLLPHEVVTEVCFTREQGGARAVRLFRGPRKLVFGGDLCAVVPNIASAMPPRFSWDDDGCRSSHQDAQQQGPYILPDEEGVLNPFATFPKQRLKETIVEREGYPLELCDASGATLQKVLSPLDPRYAVLLAQWLVISNGSRHVWLWQIDSCAERPAGSSAITIDLEVLSGCSTYEGLKGEICGVAGQGDYVILATTGRQLLKLKLSPNQPHLQIEALATAPNEMRNLRLSPESSAVAARDLQGHLYILCARVSKGNTGK